MLLWTSRFTEMAALLGAAPFSIPAISQPCSLSGVVLIRLVSGQRKPLVVHNAGCTKRYRIDLCFSGASALACSPVPFSSTLCLSLSPSVVKRVRWQESSVTNEQIGPRIGVGAGSSAPALWC
jgi:hypothetical protein